MNEPTAKLLTVTYEPKYGFVVADGQIAYWAELVVDAVRTAKAADEPFAITIGSSDMILALRLAIVEDRLDVDDVDFRDGVTGKMLTVNGSGFTVWPEGMRVGPDMAHRLLVAAARKPRTDVARMTAHTCGGPVFGRKTPGCPRCDELLGGAQPVRWVSRRKQDEEDFRRALAAHDCRARNCGPVCTAFDW